MPLIDWAARWRPVEGHQPCGVWIPPHPQPAPAPPPNDPARSPREVMLVLAPAEAEELPRHLARLVEQASPGRGDHITVDLGTATCVHLTGLHLLLALLWRRVGPHGSVDMTGGSTSLRAQLAALAVTPQHVRRDVLGAAPGAPAQPQEPAAPPVLIPQQRQGEPARLVLSGELDIANAERNRARLHEVLARGVREIEVDLSEATFMDLRTLRILLLADAALRARGGAAASAEPVPARAPAAGGHGDAAPRRATGRAGASCVREAARDRRRVAHGSGGPSRSSIRARGGGRSLSAAATDCASRMTRSTPDPAATPSPRSAVRQVVPDEHPQRPRQVVVPVHQRRALQQRTYLPGFAVRDPEATER